MKRSLSLISILMLLSFARVDSPMANHDTWNDLLSKYVSNQGKVDYKGLNSSKQKLTEYLEDLSNNPPTSSWTKEESMAYWINAYNGFTVSLILENYPVKSIMEISEGKAWDLKFIEIGGKHYSLNNIEHDILREQYFDVRIHFAVNCAAISCPKLNNKAFTAESLETTLEQLSKEFINNNSKNDLSVSPILVSQLFDWYKDDFTRGQTVIEFINKYAATKLKTGTKIAFKEYNWNLNN